MKKKIIWVLGLGILIRLALAFSTFHYDVRAFFMAGQVIAGGNILNLYDYLRNLPPLDPILGVFPADLFIYPPLTYLVLGPLTYLLSLPLGGTIIHDFIFNLSSTLGNIQLNFLLLAIKLPYLVFDLGIAAILYKLFEKPSNKFLALTLWLFNPINLYATYMMGQFDIIPTFFIALAVYMVVKRSKFLFGAFYLGLGAAFKIFPLIFLIPLALFKEKWTDRFKIILIGAGTYFLSILPFLGSQGFRSSALVAGQTTKSFYASLPISGGESILIFPLLILLFYFIFYFSKTTIDSLWKRFFVLTLLFFIFTHYHPQWFVWVTPFLVIDLVKSKLKHWPLALLTFISWLGLVTFFDPGLTTRIFAPIQPALQNAPGIWESLGVSLDINWARSILQTVFAAVGAYYIYHYLPDWKKE